MGGGNTEDTLYRIYPNGLTVTIGRMPPSAALAGLNDTTLLIDSSGYLIAENTDNASAKRLVI